MVSFNLRAAPLVVAAFAAAIATACGGGGGGGVVDNTPPTVVATDPPSDAVGVQLNDPIVATFDEPLNPGSVNASTFQVTDDMSNPVNGTVNVSGRNARFTPAANALVKAALYHAMLTTGITDSAGNALATGFSWDFTTTADVWASTVINASTPSARIDHTAVWTGGEMIVWGGTDSVTTLNTGGRYNPTGPDATAWTTTPDTAPSNVPTARTDHTAVWTGTEMIVWGGDLGGSNRTNSGGRYSTATNSWTATSTTLAPLPRDLHTAVWAGSTMIIWGGSTSIGLTNSGGRYSPNTDTWTQTNLSGAPLPRIEHTAVWTGSQMIIWGGVDDGAFLLQSGGSYRPATNSWSNVSAVGAPSPRSGHTAVWTGSEMVIWGGDDGLGPVATGGRYDPTTNSWRPMQDAPIARSGHEAVWTGTEMIVWGGEVSDNSGAAYNPAHDTWRTISIVGAPSGRTGHTAVWTGSEMIVWGGNDTALVNTGGRYAP
jgi:N-acetylneuraminic acid mutarotase